MSGSMGSSAGVGAGVDLKDSDEVIFSVVHLKLTLTLETIFFRLVTSWSLIGMLVFEL